MRLFSQRTWKMRRVIGALHLAGCGGPLRVPSPFAEENDLAAPFSPARRDEFLTGRAVLRSALRSAGCDVGAIAVRPSGAPDIPPGFRASLTHCGQTVLAVASREAACSSLGLDCESWDHGFPGLAVDIAARGDHARGVQGDAGVRLLSAKEAAFKALSDAEQLGLTFPDLVVTFEREGRVFRAEAPPRAGRPGRRLTGRQFTNGLGVVSLCIAPASGP